MEEILDEVVSSEDLKKFESAYNRQVESRSVTTDTQFNYAWCLIRSRYASDIRKGICLLEDLFNEADSEAKRDYMYYLAVGHSRLKEYDRALYYVKSFLSVEPANMQVRQLESIVRKRMEKEGLVGMALAGGAVLALGGLIGLAFAVAKK